MVARELNASGGLHSILREVPVESQSKLAEALQPKFGTSLFEKDRRDIVDIPKGLDRKRYLVLSRDNFSGWVEGRVLSAHT